jgi:hypothetical protein
LIPDERGGETVEQTEEYLYSFEEIMEGEVQKAKSAERRKQMTLRRWFKQPQLYQVRY